MRPTVKLGELADLQNGYAFKSGDYISKSKTLNFRMSNIRPGGIVDIEYNKKFLPDEYAEIYKDFLLKDGDVVIAMTDMATSPKILAVPCIVNTGGYNVLLNQRVGKFFNVDETRIRKDFLWAVLSSSKIREGLASLGGGGLQINISKKQILDIQIPLPPLETQKAIVAKLDQIFAELDQTKSEIQKNLDNTDELWKSTLNQAFHGDWEMKKLGEIAEIYSGFPYNSSDFVESSNNQVLRLGNIKNDYIRADASPVFISDTLAKETQKCKCLVDDILVTLTGTRKKRDYFFTVRVSEDNNYFINQRVGIIRLNNVKYSRYINYLLKNEKILNQVFQYETGSANQGNLGNNNVLKIMIPVPPLSEQEKIVEHLDQVSKEVKDLKSQYQSQLDNLEELKKSVLDKAFRGELG